MTTTFLNGLKVQKRVIFALMLRETKTLFGKHKLGYLWAVIKASFLVGTFWVIREVTGFQPPHASSGVSGNAPGLVPNG